MESIRDFVLTATEEEAFALFTQAEPDSEEAKQADHVYRIHCLYHRCRQEVEAWRIDLIINPMQSFVWADSVVDAAAKMETIQKWAHDLDLVLASGDFTFTEAHEQLRIEWQQDLLHRAAGTGSSTSECANTAERKLVQQMAQFLQDR